MTESTFCKICGNALSAKDITLSTSGYPFSNGHRLREYCGAPLHLHCVEKWPDRIEFSKAYYEHRYAQFVKEGWYIIAEHEDWFVGFIPPGPNMTPPAGMEDLVEVRIKDWPFVLYGHAEKWTEFFLGQWREYHPALYGRTLVRAAMVVRDVQQILPDTNTIVEVINERLSRKESAVSSSRSPVAG